MTCFSLESFQLRTIGCGYFRSVSELVKAATQASPELVRFSVWPLFIHIGLRTTAFFLTLIYIFIKFIGVTFVNKII